ncbi:MAG: phenylacetic acid degradation protein [Thermus sp.]|uniref:phenylacetic acid degradation protein n=1 Tax=Thermus sp. TaxID=275 RepID=UPI00331F4FF7
MDTEWPRWEVIKQDTPTAPLQMLGSVHAADPEHALLVARHVFVRRPSAHALFVAPADAFFMVTQEALKEGGWEVEVPGHPEKPYQVYRKASNRRSMIYGELAGKVVAQNPVDAVKKALLELPGPFFALWVVPEEALYGTEESPEVRESWFEPAKGKVYRLQSYYGLVGRHPKEVRRG